MTGYPVTLRRPRRSSALTPLDAASLTDIRPIERGDAPLVLDAFARLSVRSRSLRFLMGKSRLTDAELRYFTEVDHHDHEALVAVSRFDGRIVGGARFVRLVDQPENADLAITVVDDWQGLGLGGHLIARLIERARQEGVLRFVALVAGDNVAVAGLLRKIGTDLRVVRREFGDIEYEIALDAAGINAPRTWLAAS